MSLDTSVLDELIAKKIKERTVGSDIERNHMQADACIITLLKQLGYSETVKAWHEVDKWYA